MLLLHVLSRSSSSQWSSWSSVRALATHVVVSAEAAKAVSQHGQGLVRLPGDVLQTLEGYFKDSGLSGKVSKQQALALTEKLKALSRSTAVGGLQPYRNTSAAAAVGGRHGRHSPAGDASMTQEQLAEQREMEKELEQLAATLGPENLARFREMRAAAAAAAQLSLPRTKGGRLKSSARAALQQHIEDHGVLGLPHEAVRAAFGLPPSSSLMSQSRGEALKAATPKYTTTQALAYAVARLPSCYAAAHRIFKELAVRYPGFEPTTFMDFGAGPGTATWAAQEVWPASLSRVTAVEPSDAMSQLGKRLEAARRFAHPNAPLVRWRPDLPPVERSTRKKQQQQLHSIVVASYVLNEIPTQQERLALLRDLWGQTSDMLIIIEPGTPAGFANITEARTSILDYESRRAAKLQKRITTASHTALDDDHLNDQPAHNSSRNSSNSNSGSSSRDAAMALKASSKWFGAHVVAPCPHDAPCSLAQPGSKAWCHFGTRFQRPGFMQQAKAPAGARMNPADHQDERYSYVVLRRGSRPVDVPQVSIQRSFAPRDSSTLPPAVAFAGAPTAATSMQDLTSSSSSSMTSSSRAISIDELDDAVDADAAASGTGAGARNAAAGDPGAVNAATGASERASAVAGAGSSSASQLFSADELQQLSSLLPGPQQQQQQQQEAGSASLLAAELGGLRAGQLSKLGPYGPGLIDRLMELENAGVDWSASGAAALTPDLLNSALELSGNPNTTSTTTTTRSSKESASQDMQSSAEALQDLGSASDSDSSSDAESTASKDSDSDSSSGDLDNYVDADDRFYLSEFGSGGDDDDDFEAAAFEPAEGLLEAAGASVGWSRIIRPPRKRGGHVILDLCSPSCPSVTKHPTDISAQGADAAIVRHIVAKSDVAKQMGSAGWQLARSANWGDLWPAAYGQNEKQQVVSSVRSQD